MNDDIHALIGAYALDAVTDAERARFEEHLLVCADCRAELDGFRESAAALGSSVPVAPPPELRATVLDRITTVRQLAPIVDADEHPTAPAPASRSWRSPRGWLIAAAAAAVLVIGGLAWHPWTGTGPTTTTAAQQVLQAQDAHRYVRHVDGATATVVYSPSLGRSVLETTNMAAAPAGHTYQAWYMTRGGKATSAGLVHVSGSGSSVTVLDGHAASTALVGVTVEPAGGSPAPTTKPIMTVDLATT